MRSAPIFKDLPQATLGAIVIVAVSSFLRVGELRRFARLRRTAVVLALLALAGVLALGVLPGLIVTAALSLGLVIRRMARPPVVALARDPASGAWTRAEHHEDWAPVTSVLVIRVEGGLFYANAVAVKERILELARAPGTEAVVLDMGRMFDLDVETLDAFAELRAALAERGIELRMASVRSGAERMLRRAGLDVPLASRLDAAVGLQHTPVG